MPLDDQLTRRRLMALGLAAAAGVRAAPALATTPRSASLTVRLPYARRIGPLRIPGGLELAGLRWLGHAHVHAHLRARRPGGRWTPWLPLPHGHAAGGTDPVWTGSADAVELRLSRPVAGLTLCGVRTSWAP